MPEKIVGSLSELLARLYGAKTSFRINPQVDECEIAVTQLLTANPRRIQFLILNLSANLIFVTPDSRPGAARGILLAANGGLLTMVYSEDMETVTLPWYGTAAANNSDVFILETQLVP